VAQRARQAFDVRGQWRVVLQVRDGMFAHHVDHAGTGPPGVVDVGQPVGQARPQVQQRGGGRVLHAPPAVGRAGGDAFEQAQHRAHARVVAQRREEVHLRRAGVGETDVHPLVHQGLDEAFGTVHISTA